MAPEAFHNGVLLAQAARTFAQGLRHILQVRRSRWYYRLGQSTSTYHRGAPRATLAADRFYRKALRTLPGAGAVSGAASNSMAGLELRQTVRLRLAEHGLGMWIGRHRLGCIGFAALIAFSLVILVGPGIRRSLFSPDLAAGKVWTASSAWPGFPQTGVMSDAIATITPFHTIEEASPSVTVDLGRVAVVHQVKIENRRDCCRDRPLPLALEVSIDGANWRRVGYHRAEFRTWSATFPASPARFIRARVDRVSVLHLRRLQVF